MWEPVAKGKADGRREEEMVWCCGSDFCLSPSQLQLLFILCVCMHVFPVCVWLRIQNG